MERWLEPTLAPEASENKTLSLCVKHIEEYIVGNEDRLVQKFELKKSFWFCELPDSPENSEDVPSTNESDEDDFDCGAFVHRATACAEQRNQL